MTGREKHLCAFCGKVVYDSRLHEAFREAIQKEKADTPRASALQLYLGSIHSAWRMKMRKLKQTHPSSRLFKAMSNYSRGEGKKLHDPLAMAAVVDESVCQFAEVRVYRDRKGWGSVLETGTGTWISVDYDDDRFRQVILGATPD